MKDKLEERRMPDIWEDIIDHYSERPCNNSIGSVLKRISLATVVYYIWKERNNRLFKGEIQTIEVVMKNVEENIKLQLLSLKMRKTSNVEKIVKKWNLALNLED